MTSDKVSHPAFRDEGEGEKTRQTNNSTNTSAYVGYADADNAGMLL